MENLVSVPVKTGYASSAAIARAISSLSQPRSMTAFVGFAVYSICLALMFFFDASRAQFSSLSGDQYNILTVCAKKDYPDLLRGDMIAGNPESLDYYIPVFVNLVRLFSLPDHNYLRGLNLLLLLTNLIYLWGWWLLFSLWGNRWLAAVLAFFARGIVWPPGNELWGIAGLWTMLPRTLFLALLPWVIWLWIRRRSRFDWLGACFLCGLIVNIHPISGVVVAAALTVAESVWTLAETKNPWALLTRITKGAALILLGSAPFIWTYITKVGSSIAIEPSELDQAMRMRIGPIFWSPILYLQSWMQPKAVVLLALPWLAWLLLPKSAKTSGKKLQIALAVFAVTVLVAALFPFLIERVLRAAGYQPRFAFQFVRAGKYVMLPSVVMGAIVLMTLGEHLRRRLKYGGMIVTSVCLLMFVLTFFSRSVAFDQVPILGDDVVRFLLPAPESWLARTSEGDDGEMDDMLRWIRESTGQDARFVGPRQIRAGALRSVVHDFAGAGMLIEGDPAAFVVAARRERQLREPKYRDVVARSQLFASWGADYWVGRMRFPQLPLVYNSRNYFIYDLRPQTSSVQNKP